MIRVPVALLLSCLILSPSAVGVSRSGVVTAAPSVDALGFLVGDWRISGRARRGPAMPWGAVSGRSRIVPILDAGFLREEAELQYPSFSARVLGLYSRDRFRERYRVAFLDDEADLLDVYEGHLEDGVLEVTNAGTGTWFPAWDRPRPGRCRIEAVDADRIDIAWSMQGDYGWVSVVELVYARSGTEEPE